MKESNLKTDNSSNQRKISKETESLEYLVKGRNNVTILFNTNLPQQNKKNPSSITKNENLLKKYNIEYGIDENGNPMDIKYYYKNINTNISNLSKSRIFGTSNREPKPIAFIIKDKNSNNNILIDLKGNPILNKNKDGDYEFPLKLNILIKNFDVQNPELRVNGERNNTGKNELILSKEKMINNIDENILTIDSNINKEFPSCNKENNINEKNIINVWKIKNGNNKIAKSRSLKQINYIIKKKKNYFEGKKSSQHVNFKEKGNNFLNTYSNNKININIYDKTYEILSKTNNILNKSKKLLQNLENNAIKNEKDKNSRNLSPKINYIFTLKNKTMSYNNSDKQLTTPITNFKKSRNLNFDIKYLNTSINKTTTTSNNNTTDYNQFIPPRSFLPKLTLAASSSKSKNLFNDKKINKTEYKNKINIKDINSYYINKTKILKDENYNNKKELKFKKTTYSKKLKRKVIKCSILTEEADIMIKNFNSNKEIFNLKDKKIDYSFNKKNTDPYFSDGNQKLLDNTNASSFSCNHKKGPIFLLKKKGKINMSKKAPRLCLANIYFQSHLKNLEFKNKKFFS